MTSARSFEARRARQTVSESAGTCAMCEGPIGAGDAVLYDDQSQRAAHLDCDPSDPPSAAAVLVSAMISNATKTIAIWRLPTPSKGQ